MNNLGGMVFVVAGIALGYWVLTGKAVNFLKGISGNPQTPTTTPPTFTPGGGGGFGGGASSSWGGGSQPLYNVPQNPASNQAIFGLNDIYIPGSNVAPNNVPTGNMVLV
jgi:hypothetical protein